MINFSEFLVESEKHIFFTFGRLNPPTIGHEKLLNKLASVAGSNPYRVYLSQSQDAKKNPLSYDDKIKFARKSFPKHARSIYKDKTVKTAIDCLMAIYNEGYRNVTMVVGDDRVREFDILFNKYNGVKARHGLYKFQNINVVSAGERDPDAEGVEGMSASKLRSFVQDGNFTSFAQGVPKALSNADTKALYNVLRKGMNLSEESHFTRHIQLEPVSESREKFVHGELFEKGDQVVVKESDEIGTVKGLGTNYVIVEMANKRQIRKWIDDLEKLIIEDTE